ncbi:tetratricopeptide repeat protein [Kaarinaea lacus]
MAMFNKALQITCTKSFFVVLIIVVVNVRMGVAEELPLSQKQTQVLVEKAEVLEAEIQRRQQAVSVQVEDSKEYQSGFEDGYNKAILDLLKSKLLKDPSLSPKPRGAGLQATAAKHSAQQRPRQYEPVANPSAAVTSPAVPVEVPEVSLVPLVPMVSSGAGISSGAGVSSGAEISSGSGVSSASGVSSGTKATSEVHANESAVTSAAAEMAETPAVDSVVISTTTSVSAGTSSSALSATANTPVAQTTPQQQQAAAQDWLQKSNSYLTEKRWQQAIDAATQAVALDSTLVDSYIVRSWAYAENGQNQQAMTDIDTAIGMDPDNALAYNNRAYIYELLYDAHNAQQNYQQACELGYQPACDTVSKLKQVLEQQRLAKIGELTDRSYQQFQRQEWRGVVKTTTELLALDPENTAALVNRAGAFTELGEYQKAMEDCNTALIIDPNMAIAYNNKGYVLELMGELKKAAMEYETACVLGVQQSCSDHKRLSQKVSALN